MNSVGSINEMLGIPTTGEVKARGRNEMGQEDFLALMVAQLENQDPTKPMDNNEFLSQMAQFSMVNGIEGLNTSFSSVSEAILGAQGLQAATLLDRQAMIETPWGHFDGVEGVAGFISGASGASQVEVQIRDAQGSLVRSVAINPNGQDRLDFEWDGLDQTGQQVARGAYHISAVGAVNGGVLSLSVATASRIGSVSLDPSSQQVTLNLANGQTVGLGEVREYR
ncbi:MAG: flagellar hook capping FlgD N-terminal domain-containing protein [Betaproteobacteria bacterium]